MADGQQQGASTAPQVDWSKATPIVGAQPAPSSAPTPAASGATPAQPGQPQVDWSRATPVVGAQPAPKKPTGPTIGPAPKASDMPTFGYDWMNPEQRMTMPLAKALIMAHDKLREVENMTQEGRKAHPIQYEVGQVADRIEGFLFGGAQNAGNGIGNNKYGILTNPVTASIIPGMEGEGAAAAEPALVRGLAGGASLVKQGVTAGRELFAGKTAVTEGTEAASKAPGIVKQIFQGEKVAQPAAQEALTGGGQAAAEAAGTEATAAPKSLRTVLENPISSLESQSKANYKLIDNATGGKFQPNADKLANINKQLKAITGTDDAKEASLLASKTRLEWQQEGLFDEAAKSGVPTETVETARSQFRQSQALRDLESRVFKNPNVISGNTAHGAEESVNVNNAVKALQKMEDDTEFGGSRLEQALGKDGAKSLLDDMYAAQKAGQKALTRQQWAKRVGAALGVGTAEELIRRSVAGATTP